MKKCTYLMFMLASLSGSACQTSKIAQVATTPCGENTKTIKRVKDQSGVVRYNAAQKQYAIVVTVPNTIDSQEVGVVCQLPQSVQKDGLRVRFDGAYKVYDKTPSDLIGGQTYYYLEVDKITSTDSHN